MGVITEHMVRKEFSKNGIPKQYNVSDNDTLTPAAIDFLKERKVLIQLVSKHPFSKPVNKDAWTTDTTFINFYTGEVMDSKPESMTHLFENKLVEKDHPRILLRGRLDSLQAQILEVQVYCNEKKHRELVMQLEELLLFTRELLRSEVLDKALPEVRIFGMNAQEIREHSHNPQKYFGLKQMVLVHYSHGPFVSKLNMLRTFVRECELVAVQAFKNNGENNSLIQALNRLSSCFHILMYQELKRQEK